MDGTDVCAVLREKRINELHHANTVATSLTFLTLGGLASRGEVERQGLRQTEQYTDPLDKRYGIWNDVFTDTVDIHGRARRLNQYGPVLFILPVDVLEDLPDGTEVMITKKNPTKWVPKEAPGERYFADVDELEEGLTRGTFDQMVTLRLEDGILSFPEETRMLVDDPQRSPNDAFKRAMKQLAPAAAAAGVALATRTCGDDCACVNQYAQFRGLDGIF